MRHNHTTRDIMNRGDGKLGPKTSAAIKTKVSETESRKRLVGLFMAEIDMVVAGSFGIPEWRKEELATRLANIAIRETK